MENNKLLEILGRIPFFKNLDEKEKELVLSMPKVYELFSPNEHIVKEGGGVSVLLYFANW